MSAAPRIGLHGFGRVGEALVERLAAESTESAAPRIVAINETTPERLEALRVRCERRPDARPTILSESDPSRLPWGRLGVDVVIEAARWFDRAELEAQSDGGRIPVVMTGDLRVGRPDLTLVLGVNEARYAPDRIVLCAGSDRTQAFAPLLALCDECCGVEAFHFVLRRSPYARATGRNYVNPRQADQLADVLPALRGRGVVTRVEDPRAAHVEAWCEFELGREPDDETLNEIWRRVAQRFSGVVRRGDSPTDPRGDRHSLIVDQASVAADGRRLWLAATYDPIASYVERLVEIAKFLAAARNSPSS